MVLAVEQRHFEIDHRLAERAFLQVVAQPFLDGGDEVARHHAAHDLVDEAEARAARQRLDLDLDVGELAVAAGLPLVAGMLLRAGLDGLAIGDARRRRLDGDVVAAGELVDRDLEMHLALALEQQLVGLGRAPRRTATGPPRRSCAGRPRASPRRSGSWPRAPGRRPADRRPGNRRRRRCPQGRASAPTTGPRPWPAPRSRRPGPRRSCRAAGRRASGSCRRGGRRPTGLRSACPTRCGRARACRHGSGAGP